MLLDKIHIDKIDLLLKEALSKVQENEDKLIRVSLLLDKVEPKVDSLLSPSKFPSRQAYRKALIEQRRFQINEALGDTIQSLKELSLKTVSDNISSVIVVEGQADQILKALEIPGVCHASLDRLISIPNLISPNQIDYVANIYSQSINGNLDQKTIQTINQATEQYILDFYKEFGKLPIWRMSKPVNLESVFTEVKCLEKPHPWWLEESTNKRKIVFQYSHQQRKSK